MSDYTADDDAMILSAGVVSDTTNVFYSTRSLNNAVDLNWLKVDDSSVIYSHKFLDMQFLENYSTGERSQTLAVSMQEDIDGKTQFTIIDLDTGILEIKNLEIGAGIYTHTGD